jgi:hypothetical protein
VLCMSDAPRMVPLNSRRIRHHGGKRARDVFRDAYKAVRLPLPRLPAFALMMEALKPTSCVWQRYCSGSRWGAVGILDH